MTMLSGLQFKEHKSFYGWEVEGSDDFKFSESICENARREVCVSEIYVSFVVIS